jgi:6-pyruvoyltetrahydropterin/6-carboxytetrahydropterin synthase
VNILTQRIGCIIQDGLRKKTCAFLANAIIPIFMVGVPDSKTGYVIDMKILSDLIKYHVLDKFDHKNLNLDTKEFANLNPTAENIAIVIFQILRPLIEPSLDIKIRLYETERNFVEYPA